jgi:hypothetical protein
LRRAGDKEEAICAELERFTRKGELTTVAEVAKKFGVWAMQVQALIETKGEALGSIEWHSMRGRWGTLLCPTSAPVVELLHRSWQTHRKEIEGLRAEVGKLTKELQTVAGA